MTMPVLVVCCWFISIIHLLDANQQALTGSTVKLICPHKATPSYPLRWDMTKEGSAPVYYAENTYINTRTLSPEVYNRLSISGNHTAGEYHLNIADVRKSDEGGYECSVRTFANKIMLNVIVGPTALSLDNVTPDNTILGIEGQDMNIKCTAVGGQPPPDIMLVILGSIFTGKQSAQHTLKPHNSHDGSTVTCQAGYIDINYFPLNTTAYIHLKLKPVIIPFAEDTLSTEETNSFNVSCQSTSSRPAATMYWLLGQHRIDVTPNSTSQTIHDPPTDKYSVTSNLKYKVDRSYNGKKLTCGASNIAGSMETFLTLNVKYAPGVTVENTTFSQTQSPRQIQSTLNSNPPVNTCKWHQQSKYGEHIREFKAKNQILTLPTVSYDQIYQDAGEYVCTAENGIIGINGQLKQTGCGYVISNAPPVITVDNNYTQYAQFGKSTELKVNVYSIPKYSRISWFIDSTQLVSNRYAITEAPAIVKDVFHGVEVQLDGYRVTLAIRDLHVADFTNYTLRLYHTSGQYMQHEVTLESASAPETPSNFTITSLKETSITVQWIPGYDGGQKQTFYVQYRTNGTNTWMLQKIKTINQIDIHNIYTLSGLQDETTYELRMYAQNVINQSPKTDTATTTTLQSVFTDAQTSSNALTGAVAGVVVVLLIICAIIISTLLFRRKKGMKQTKKDTGFYENSGFQNVQNGDEYEEVVSKSDAQQKQTSKTYESLGTKNAVDVYDDLDNSKGPPSSKPSVDLYESLSAKDKPNFYEKLENQQGQTEKVYVNEAL